jgi:hypothetical protein
MEVLKRCGYGAFKTGRPGRLTRSQRSDFSEGPHLFLTGRAEQFKHADLDIRGLGPFRLGLFQAVTVREGQHMSKENKGYSSIKLAWRDFRAEGTGLGVAAIVIIVVIVVWGLGQGGYTL